MKTHALIFAFIVSFLFFSCKPNSQRVALQKIMQLYQTQEVKASYGFDYNAEKKKINYIEIQVSNSPVINAEGYNTELAASTIALTWYNALDNEYLEKYDAILVIIQTEKSSIKYEYPFGHLSNINTAYDFLTSYLNEVKAKNYSAAAEDIDTTFFGDINKKGLQQMFESATQQLGPLKTFRLKGFGVHKAEFDEKKVNCIFIWTTSYYKDKYSDVLYLLDLDDKSDRILGFQSL